MRVNYLLASNVVVNPELYAYVALSLGHEAHTSLDAWAFLVSAEFSGGRGAHTFHEPSVDLPRS